MISIKPLDSINPTLIKQYSYCPVIVWLKAWFLLEEPVTDSMTLGKECVKPPEGVGQLFIRTRQGSTIIDEVLKEDNDSRTIIEKKAYRSHNYSRYVEQVVASYIIAREVIPGIRKAKLKIEEKTKTIELNDDLINDVEKIIEKTREITTREKTPPKPINTGKCTSCWYKRYCPHW